MDQATILEKLRRRFGKGQDPARREALYRRICSMVEQHGEKAYKLLCEAAAEAAGARFPDRYFCTAIVRKFTDNGISPTDF